MEDGEEIYDAGRFLPGCGLLVDSLRRERTWWRNLKGGAEVGMHVRGKDVQGLAEAILDEKAVAFQMKDYIRRIPMAARSLGVRMENGGPHPEDTARLVQERMFVRVRLSA